MSKVTKTSHDHVTILIGKDAKIESTTSTFTIMVMSQDPAFFPGSLRSNLDFSGKLTDERLWGVLDQVGLRDRVAGIRGGLSADVSVDASLLSLGQRQLLFLAQAIIRKPKLVVFDEATEVLEHGYVCCQVQFQWFLCVPENMHTHSQT